jgi:hypothetical protein
MGQQQLVITVLSVILVGLATYGWLRMCEMYNQGSNRDKLVAVTYTLVGSAESYEKRPVSQGGGGGSFSGLDLTSRLLNTTSGKITCSVSPTQLTFTATGVVNGKNGKSSVHLQCVYS